MQPLSPTKILRQRATAVALLLSAVLAVAAVSITVLGVHAAYARSTSRSNPLAAAARGAVAFVEVLFDNARWG